MIEKIFNEIVEEAQNGQINLREDGFDFPIRMEFLFGEYCPDKPSLLFENYDEFKKYLNEYVALSLEFYGLQLNEDNIKTVLAYLWSNITNLEMPKIEDYLKRRVAFLCDDIFPGKETISDCELGIISGKVEKQIIKQETPYCFKSYFKRNEDIYYLPRISFGIQDGICYIYAIQNKDSKNNTNDPEYNELVQRSMRSINSGVKKYRNVTPSFVIALTLFTSFLKQNGIEKIEVLSPLPLRQQNKKLVNDYIIARRTMKGNLLPESIEFLKTELEDKRIRDDYNATVKFRDCFNRLKVHFSGIYLSYNQIDNRMLLEILELSTSQPFLQQMVANSGNNMLK